MAFNYQNFASLGVNLNRQNYGPLDISNVFTSEADLKYYLSKGNFTEGVSEYWSKIVPYPYEGQVLATVIDNIVNVFVLALDENNEFITQEIAGKITTDEATITLADNGAISLFGTDGLEITKTNDAGEEVSISYQPVFKDGKLTWRELSSTTIEDVGNQLQGLDNEISELRKDFDNLQIPEVPANVSAFTNDAGYQNANQVSEAIVNAIKNINHAVFEKVDSKPDASAAAPNVLYLVANGDKYDIYAKIGEEMVLIDDTDVDLSGYVTDAELDDYVKDIELIEILGNYATKSEYVSSSSLEEILTDYSTKNDIKDFLKEDNVLDILTDKKYITEESLNTVLSDYLTVEEALQSEDVLDIIALSFQNKSILDLITQDHIDALNKGELIASISNDFILNDSKELSINEIAQGKVSGLLDRLTEIEGKLTPNAQENILESISLNGTALDIINKTVNIPVATNDTIGLVMGSSEDNEISIKENGVMTVNSLNVNKLFQDNDSYLVLNGGNASLNIDKN